MTRKTQFTIRQVAWSVGRDDLHAIRRKVFIEEQQVPEELEWDGEDEVSSHVLAVAEGGMPIGTARLLRDGHIGRMAVLKEWRSRGVGSALMRHLLGLARASGHEVVRLHAQIHAAGFYAKHGFAVEGGAFMEAGIPHVVMTRTLGDGDD
jgi:predicted GNAT family N-acyltransferase